MWINHSLEHVFGIEADLTSDTAMEIYDAIDAALARPEFRPRALFDRFKIDVLATTEGPLDSLEAHAAIAASDWGGRVITTYRPDAVVDPDARGFQDNLRRFGEITGEDTQSWQGYLAAHRARRAVFKAHGATATDHGHPSARTANLSPVEAEALFGRVLHGPSAEDAELFRAQMLAEMARMSLEDGLVMQIHPGSRRNHSARIFERYGPDRGFDIPGRTDDVTALAPLLEVAGHAPGFTLIVFTLDETSYGRELAPMAGVYPALKLGPGWWFFDSAEGMRRYRELTTETAGFYNTAGFNDDTRAFTSIPARHDVARRVDCAYLAEQVLTGRLTRPDAEALAVDLTVGLARRAYNL